MAASVRDYVTRYPNADYRTLTARFGEPQQIAETCVAEMETDELLNALSIKKKVFTVVLITSAIIIVLWAGLVITSYFDHVKNANGYLVIEEIEIESRTITSEGGN